MRHLIKPPPDSLYVIGGKGLFPHSFLVMEWGFPDITGWVDASIDLTDYTVRAFENGCFSCTKLLEQPCGSVMEAFDRLQALLKEYPSIGRRV